MEFLMVADEIHTVLHYNEHPQMSFWYFRPLSDIVIITTIIIELGEIFEIIIPRDLNHSNCDHQYYCSMRPLILRFPPVESNISRPFSATYIRFTFETSTINLLVQPVIFFLLSSKNYFIVDYNDEKNGHILPTGQWYAPSAVINDAWYCLVLHGIALYCIVFHGIAWYCMVVHGIAW